MSAPVFLAEHARLDADHIVLDGPEGRHAAAVRRLRVGERVDLTDGAGLLVECVVAAVARERLELTAVSRRVDPVPEPRILVIQALPKGERAELAVATMTELGVDVIVPWAAARCVTTWRPERRAKALARWRSTAREAAKQARRSRLPKVESLATTATAVRRVDAAELTVVLHEEATTSLGALDVPRTGTIAVVVGPEGGLTDEETAAFGTVGGVAALLGPTVLRTSTAGPAALSVLLSRCGRW